MKKTQLIKALFAALVAAGTLTACDEENAKVLAGDVPYVSDESSEDDFVKVDEISEEDETETVLAGDVPYIPEDECDIETGEIPEDDDSFVKLDPVQTDDIPDEYILDGDIAYLPEDADKENDGFDTDGEADGEDALILSGMIPAKE